MSQANPLRGEAMLLIGGLPHILRPTFSALVAAEGEIGPLFALVERAGAGALKLEEMACLFWHCLDSTTRPNKDTVGAAIVEAGLASCAAPLRTLLSQILKGSR